MSKISYTGFPGLSVMISVQFAIKMLVTAQNGQKSIKPLFLHDLESSTRQQNNIETSVSLVYKYAHSVILQRTRITVHSAKRMATKAQYRCKFHL